MANVPIKKGWLTNGVGEVSSPNTFIDQIYNNDGTLATFVKESDLSAIKTPLLFGEVSLQGELLNIAYCSIDRVFNDFCEGLLITNTALSIDSNKIKINLLGTDNLEDAVTANYFGSHISEYYMLAGIYHISIMPIGSKLMIDIFDIDSATVNGHTVDSDVPENAKFTDTITEVVNTLTSTDTNKALSANQGKVLDEKIKESKVDVVDNLTTKDATKALSANAGNKLNTNMTRKSMTLAPFYTTTSLPVNADLNDVKYMKVGTYYCSSNATAASIQNGPVGNVHAFIMHVFSPISPDIDNETTTKYVYRVRKILNYDGDEWIQDLRFDDIIGTPVIKPWRRNDGTDRVALVSSSEQVVKSTINDTPIYVQSAKADTYIGYRNNSGESKGFIGVSNDKRPIFYGNGKRSYISLEENLEATKETDINSNVTDSSDSPIAGLYLKGKSEQYISPNLLKSILDTQTVSGVTCTKNPDGTYTLNGTATATVSFVLYSSVKLPFSSRVKYVGGPKNGTGSTYNLSSWYNTGTKNVFNVDYGNGVVIEPITDKPADKNFTMVINVFSGYTCNNLVFKPMLTTDLTATYDDYEPYTGTPAPDNEVPIKNASGVVETSTINLLPQPLTKEERNGSIDFRLNDDGSIYMKGTASSNVSGAMNVPITLKKGTYTFSGAPNGSASTYFIQIVDNPVTKELYQITTPRTITFDKDTDIIARPRVLNGATVDVTIYPMIIEGTTASEYVEYKRNTITLEGNVWDEQWELGAYDVTNGNKTVNTQNIRSANPIPIVPNAKYTFIKPSNTLVRIVFYNANKGFLSYIVDATLGRYEFTSPNNAYFMVFYYGGTSYNNDTAIIKGSVNNYISYADSMHINLRSVGDISDELFVRPDGTAEHTGRIYSIKIKNLSWGYDATYLRFFANGITLHRPVRSLKMLCPIYECITDERAFSIDFDNAFYCGGNDGNILLHDHRFNNVQDFIDTVGDYEIYYPLPNPIITELTPEQVNYILSLKTFEGYTKFESELDGTVTYVANTKTGDAIGDIREKEQKDFEYLNNSTLKVDENGKMTAPIKWADNGVLPVSTSSDYFLVIDPFANGGTTRWINRNNAAVAKLITNNEAGYTTDNYGNFQHRRKSNSDSLILYSNDGNVYSQYYWEYGDFKFPGHTIRKIVQANAPAGSTSITLSDSRITTDSVITPYIKVSGSTAPLKYKTIEVKTGAVTLTFDAQSAQITVGITIDEFY